MAKATLFYFITGTFFLSVFCGLSLNVRYLIILAFTTLLLGLFVLFIFSLPKASFGLLLLFEVLGLCLGRLALENNSYQSYFGSTVTLSATVISDPIVERYSTQVIVQPDFYKQNILVNAGDQQNYFYGQRLYLSGKINATRNIADFDYVDFLKAKNIYAQMNSTKVFIINQNYKNPFIYFSLRFKAFLYRKIFKYLTKEDAATLIALVTGQKNYLSKVQGDWFKSTGTIHLIAVSGYKLTLLLIILEKFKKYLEKKYLILLSLLISFIFLAITNFAPSVMRASLMSFIYLYSRFTSRRFNFLAALLVAAMVLVSWNPLILKYDSGFQLSVLGILGIIYFSPFLRVFFSYIPNNFIKEILIANFAAQWATFPLILYSYKEIYLLSFIPAILILPFFPLIIVLGYAFIFPLIGQVASVFVIFFLKYLYLILIFFSNMKFLLISANLSSRGLVELYILQVTLIISVQVILLYKKRFANITE